MLTWSTSYVLCCVLKHQWLCTEIKPPRCVWLTAHGGRLIMWVIRRNTPELVWPGALKSQSTMPVTSLNLACKTALSLPMCVRKHLQMLFLKSVFKLAPTDSIHRPALTIFVSVNVNPTQLYFSTTLLINPVCLVAQRISMRIQASKCVYFLAHQSHLFLVMMLIIPAWATVLKDILQTSPQDNAFRLVLLQPFNTEIFQLTTASINVPWSQIYTVKTLMTATVHASFNVHEVFLLTLWHELVLKNAMYRKVIMENQRQDVVWLIAILLLLMIRLLDVLLNAQGPHSTIMAIPSTISVFWNALSFYMLTGLQTYVCSHRLVKVATLLMIFQTFVLLNVLFFRKLLESQFQEGVFHHVLVEHTLITPQENVQHSAMSLPNFIRTPPLRHVWLLVL